MINSNNFLEYASRAEKYEWRTGYFIERLLDLSKQGYSMRQVAGITLQVGSSVPLNVQYYESYSEARNDLVKRVEKDSRQKNPQMLILLIKGDSEVILHVKKIT